MKRFIRVFFAAAAVSTVLAGCELPTGGGTPPPTGGTPPPTGGGTPPSAPSISSVMPANSRATVTWAAVSGATSYNLYWTQGSSVSVGTGTKVMNVTSPYVVSTLTNGDRYAFLVTAVNASGESSGSGVLSTAVGNVPRIEQISFTSTSFQVDGLSNDTGATSYNLYYTTGSTVTPATGTALTGYTTGTAVTSLSTGTQYAVIVTPVYSAGEGPASAVATVTPSTAPAIGFANLSKVVLVLGMPGLATFPGGMTMTNTGGGTLSGIGGSVTGYTGGASGWLSLDSFPGDLVSGAPGTIGFTVTPPGSLSGASTATISITGTGAAAQEFTVTISEDSSSTTVGDIQVSPAVPQGGTFDFGPTVAAGQVDTVVFSVTNTSGSTITTGAPFVSGPTGQFVPIPFTADSATLANSDVAVFAIAYVPLTFGSDGPQTVSVTWTGGTSSPYTFSIQGSAE